MLSERFGNPLLLVTYFEALFVEIAGGSTLVGFEEAEAGGRAGGA